MLTDTLLNDVLTLERNTEYTRTNNELILLCVHYEDILTPKKPDKIATSAAELRADFLTNWTPETVDRLLDKIFSYPDNELQYILEAIWLKTDRAFFAIVSSPDYTQKAITMKSIARIGMHRTKSSRGHGRAVRYRPNQSEWARIVEETAKLGAGFGVSPVWYHGDETGNNGERFESAITGKKKDVGSFWTGADCILGADTYTIKGSGATVINETTAAAAIRWVFENDKRRALRLLQELAGYFNPIYNTMKKYDL